MWTAPLIGAPSRQAAAFANFIRSGSVLNADDEGCRIIVRQADEHNIFRINNDHLVVEWIKIMPLPNNRRVAYLKTVTINAYARAGSIATASVAGL